MSSEYVRQLVRRDWKERAQERVEILLLVGLESGEAAPLDREYRVNLLRDLKGRRQKES